MIVRSDLEESLSSWLISEDSVFIGCGRRELAKIYRKIIKAKNKALIMTKNQIFYSYFHDKYFNEIKSITSP